MCTAVVSFLSVRLSVCLSSLSLSFSLALSRSLSRSLYSTTDLALQVACAVGDHGGAREVEDVEVVGVSARYCVLDDDLTGM